MQHMTKHEYDILQEIAEPGSVKELSWGAAMSAALEYLQGHRYVTRGSRPKLTEKGLEVLQRKATLKYLLYDEDEIGHAIVLDNVEDVERVLKKWIKEDGCVSDTVVLIEFSKDRRLNPAHYVSNIWLKKKGYA